MFSETNRLEQKEKDFKGDFLMEEKTKDNTSLRNIEDNKAYRYSMEGKRLLSTSSNASNDRYSVVPPAAGMLKHWVLLN